MKLTELMCCHSQLSTYVIKQQVDSAGFLCLFPLELRVSSLCSYLLKRVPVEPFLFCGLLTKPLRLAVLIWGQWPAGSVILTVHWWQSRTTATQAWKYDLYIHFKNMKDLMNINTLMEPQSSATVSFSQNVKDFDQFVYCHVAGVATSPFAL